MCGIIGISTKTPTPDLDQRLSAALQALRHRGPDDQGLETFSVTGGKLVLGHTRLSIIDLSSKGHQPMHSPDGRYIIVYNGEIYNYRELRQELLALGHDFHTDSDTEVLLAAWAQWGVDSLRRLTGMFAFAVFDSVSQSLTLARDAFGIKPLFYASTPNGLFFSSEIPVLLKVLPHRPEFNLQRAYDYLVFGSYDNGHDTFYQGIQHLLPGHWLTFDLRDLHLESPVPWWWPSIEERTDLSFEQAAEELRERFMANVRLHLRSDVPLGAALSGGVDSSAIVCTMRHLEPDMPIHTFTFVARGSAADEERWADQVNQHVGAIPHKVTVSPEELANDLDAMMRAQGEPFGGTSIYAQYRVFQSARNAGIKVLLEGQGADELLAGYDGFPVATTRSMLDRRDWSGLIRFMRYWPEWPGRSRATAIMILLSHFIPAMLRNMAYRTIGRNPTPPWINIAQMTDKGVEIGFPLQTTIQPDEGGRRLMNALRQRLSGGMMSALLRHSDRNSMWWSIESRVPFLTVDLANFLLSLPETYLLSPQGETKRIFRAAMRGIVPDALLDRRDKIGFQTPEHNWLRNLSPYLREWLDGATQVSFLDAAKCIQSVNAVISGEACFSFQAWRLVNFCRWMQLSQC